MPIATIPAKNNIQRSAGTIILTITSETTPVTEHLLTIGDFSLHYRSQGFVLQTDPVNVTKQLHLYTTPFPGEVRLIWSWIGKNHRLMSLKDGNISQISAEDSAIDGTFGDLNFVQTPYFSGHYVALSIYAADILYEEASIQEVARFQTRNEPLFEVDFREGATYRHLPFVEGTMVPNDGSPLLVSRGEKDLNRQYFFDLDTGLYREYNEESFTYRGEDELILSYTGVDETKTITVECEGEAVGNPIALNGSVLSLSLTETEKDYWYGKELTVRYILKDSYIVDYEDAAFDSYKILLPGHTGESVTVFQEGNRFSGKYLAEEIEMNPLVNPRHQGFLYLSDEPQKTVGFRATIMDDYLIADGYSVVDLIVEGIDDQDNEVLSPYITATVMDESGKVLGEFSPVISKDTLLARNAAGRAYFRYALPALSSEFDPRTRKYFAVLFDRKSQAGSQVPFFLRPAIPGASPSYLKKQRLATATASLVFEYFARYFGKEIPEGHPILLCDRDLDGSLGDADLEQLIQDQYNHVRMNEIYYALASQEVF